MVLNLHYREKIEFKKGKMMMLDLVDSIPLIGMITRSIIKRHKIVPYELTLNLDKIKTEMFIKNKRGNVVSEMTFSELDRAVFSYNKKYESFGFFPNMATFNSKRSNNVITIPLSKRSDYFNLKKELNSMGVESSNKVRVNIILVLLASLILGTLAVVYGGPFLLDMIFTEINKNI